MRSEKRGSSRTAATPPALSWHRVARHPAGIVVFAADAFRRRAPRTLSTVYRHSLRSTHA
ncbi:MAG: hypothetical protein KGN77_14650 [Xanthomonadaceae bacterium]|nr:hypothetical protein [Xanthomonadaceae bacterium]MDE1963170.1 hypothetical protein [Xanthomonadaceae bacterium]